ncbi:macrolide ABC transporter permease [Desulforamulus profundi]|uniref:Macrolide ABC transporter permease n=1 Tax=Desulforamulus profundi TaxID=1383067 RepID=A0A2C6MID8_9FIRM|nr:ABC transporter permease [Desulforamulus profundi]PHJ39293.1 macrolide ABC transporter permease [Desulforamulus profundi]
MKISELVKMALVNILGNKVRAFLTALGVIVGAATIILVVAVGKGGQASVAQQFAKLNAGTIFVMSSQSGTYKKPLTTKDVAAIREKAPAVGQVTVLINGKAESSFNNRDYRGDVVGVFPEAQPLNNLKVQAGRFISQDDNKQRNKVVVLGSEVAKELFGDDTVTALSSTVKVHQRNLKVVGVLERLGDATGGVNFDESAIVPYEVAEKYILGTTVYPRMVAQARDLASVPAAMSQIAGVLRETHRLRGDDDFFLRDAGSKLAAAQDSARTMSLMLVIVATIVLVVGGIGIMNVMLVSVKERTREIGILKAIGARKKDILLQFLLEAVIISLAGGIVGVSLGLLMLPLMKYAGLKAIPSTLGVVLGMVFSVATGTFFGYYPAKKAADLSPLEALSYD